MWINRIIDILQALLTPVIAIVAIYIAYQQLQTNRQKLTLEMYEKRLHIYEEVKKILSIVLRDAKVSTDDLLKFRTSVSEADFLFEPEIIEYIDEIYKRGLKLNLWNEKYCGRSQEKPEGYNHQKICDEKDKELSWLTEQFEPAKEKFKKYLTLNNQSFLKATVRYVLSYFR